MGDYDAPTSAPPPARRRLGPLRRSVGRALAEALRRDPDLAARAIEVGLVDRRWIEDPHSRPLTTAAPGDVVQRFLERAVEERPSFLPGLGLSALQVLASFHERGGDGLEERQVVVVFTDLEGFTSYTEANGDRAAIDLLRGHHRAVGPIVRRGGGRIVKRLGDGLMLSFLDAGEALDATLALLATAPTGLRLRAGAHLGPALVQGDDLLGHVVNVSARLCERAAGGEALVSAAVVSAAGPRPETHLGPARTLRLKGVDGAVVAHLVSAVGGGVPAGGGAHPAPVRSGTDEAHEIVNGLRAALAGGRSVTVDDLDEVLALLEQP